MEIVDKINDEIEDAISDEDVDILDMKPCLTLTYGTNVTSIQFLDEYLWDSDNDPRDYIEENDDYEPLENFLRRTLKIKSEVLIRILNVFINKTN